MTTHSSVLSSEHSGGSTHNHPHVMPLSVYFTVFGMLLVLTAVTVGVSLLALPSPYAALVALGVATIKASLVALYFMHLRYDDKFYTFIFLVSLLFVTLFFSLTMLDMSSRGFVQPDQDNGLFDKYETPQAPPISPDAAKKPDGDKKPDAEKK